MSLVSSFFGTRCS